MDNFTTTKREAEIDGIYKGSYMLTIGDYQCDFHFHDTWEFYLQIDGVNTYYIGDKIYRPVVGDLLISPPGVIHQMHNRQITSPYECYVVFFSNSFLHSATENKVDLLTSYREYFVKKDYLLRFSGNDLAFLTGLLNGLVNDDRSEEFRLSLAYSLAYYIQSRFAKKSRAFDNAEESHIISIVVQYLNEHFTEPLSLDSICDTLFISKSYLTRYFKEHTSLTVYDYILNKRVAMAQQLLQEKVSAIDAAERCGFSDYSNFYRIFTRKTGSTPRQFQDNIRKAQPEQAASHPAAGWVYREKAEKGKM